MRGEVYAVLAEHVDGALDYVIRWQPNEYEPDRFVERVRPLELTNGVLMPADCRAVERRSSPTAPRLRACAVRWFR